MHLMKKRLKIAKAQGTYRSLDESRNLQRLDFASNDYLGFSTRPEIRQSVTEALVRNIRLGATGSRLLGGNLEIHSSVERFIADRFKSESALLFSSGYLANMAVTSALGSEESEFFSDELNHASLIDGMRLTPAKRTIFRHNDPDDLRRKLRRSRSERKVIITESVFSMDGDLSPLEDLLALAREFNAWLVLDEAHATGVFGSKGLGRLESQDIAGVDIVSIHTCGKALGAQGAFVLSNQIVREYIINFSRPFIFSTALSPILALQIQASISLLDNLSQARVHLLHLARFFRERMNEVLPTSKSESQIVPLVLGSNDAVLRASKKLQDEGFDVRPVRSPAVPKDTERLRISLKSFHTQEDVNRLTTACQRMLFE